MAKDTQSLRVNVTGDASKLTKELDGVAGRMDKFGKGMQSTGKTLTKFVTGPIAGAAAGMAGLATSAAKTGDRLDKTSKSIGVNTDLLQDLEHWASQNGVAQDQMEKAVGRLNQRVGMAVQGNEKWRSSFESIGVSIEGAGGQVRDTDEILRDTITTIQGMDSSAERAGAATEVFGTKVARDLLPALESGNLSLEDATAAMDEHGRMTDEQIAKSVEFSDQWDNLKRSAESLKNEVGAELLPLFTDSLLPALEEHVIPAVKAAAETMGDLIEGFNDLPGPAQAAVGGTAAFAAALGPVLWTGGLVVQQVARMATGFQAASGAARTLTTRLGGLRGALVGGIGIGVTTAAMWELHRTWVETGEEVERTVDTIIRQSASAEEAIKGINATLEDHKDEVTSADSLWSRLGHSLTGPIGAFHNANNAVDDARRALGLLQGRTKAANTEFESTGEILPSVTRFVEDLENPLDNTGGLLDDIGVSSGDAAGGLGDVRDEADELSDAAKNLKDDLDKLNESTISVERAAIAWGDQIGSLDEKLKETSGTLDINTEEGRANRGMLLDTAEAARDHVQAMIDDGASTEQATKALTTHIGELRAQAIQGGVSEEAIDSYISTLNLTPEHIKTQVEAATEEAEAKIRGFQGLLEEATRDKSVDIGVTGTRRLLAGGAPTGHSGGRIEDLPWTAGGPRGDERLVKAQTGERLLNRGETRAFEQLHGGEMVRVLKRIEAKLDRGGGDGMQVVIQNPQREPAEDSLARANRNSAYLAGK